LLYYYSGLIDLTDFFVPSFQDSYFARKGVAYLVIVLGDILMYFLEFYVEFADLNR